MREPAGCPQPSAISRQLPTGLWLSFLCGLLAGCAQGNPAITAMPSDAELPRVGAVQRTIPVSVTVEGRGAESRVRLVPDFKEPELTAKEKEALGLDKIHFKFLLYNELSQPVGSRVGNWYAGVSTATDRRVRVWSLYDPHSHLVGVAGRGGVATGVDASGSRVSGAYGPRDTTAATGPSSAIVVETDNAASRVAERKPHDEP